jgi:RNA polymerase sigma factor (sigma-70 family)
MGDSADAATYELSTLRAIVNNRRLERPSSPGAKGSSTGLPTDQTSSRVATGGRHARAEASADSHVKDEALFLSSLPVIDDVTGQVCRRHRLSADESDDFKSEVRLHFIQREYEPLRRFEGRSSLHTYLTVVIQRLFLDYRNRLWGKWRPSVEAKRLGPSAILIERLVSRDHWTFDQVVTMFRVNLGESLEGPLAAFCEKVCARPPSRQVVSESEAEGVESGDPLPDANVVRAEQDFLARRVRTALERAREALAPEERLILKMRFDERLPVADIARALHHNQKRLYRTIERILASLCGKLEADGISREDIKVLFADGPVGVLEAYEPGELAGAVEASDVASEPAEAARTPWLQKR